jgi:class 3 adenylate cyclase
VEAERRQITVLFADMVGFTTFSERSGEEAAFSLMQSLAKLMEDAVREQGGSVQGFTGDGVMAVFGAPVAYEDAPLRACRAALAILQRLKAAGGDLEGRLGTRPQLRIGMNSGPAVVGKVQGGSDAAITVLGDTVNVAARLQALAEPGSAVLSDVTHRLVQGLAEVSLAGEHEVKGKSERQKVYRLDAVREGTTRFSAKVQLGLTAYVGRDRELEILRRGFTSIGSDIQVFDIVGEPGIGKSRLVHEFLGQIARERARVLTGSCTPDGQQTPFQAFIEIVRGTFQLSPSDTEAIVARKLDEGLEEGGLRSSENLGLLINLLGLKAPPGALDGLDGVLIGLRTRELLLRLVQAHSRMTPTIMVFEDLHWLDSASEDLLAKIIAFKEPLQLLVLHTRRTEFTPAWTGQSRIASLPIEPLSARETARIAQARLGVDQLPETLGKMIAAKAEGNALFAEELASFLLERGIVRRSAAGLDYDPPAVAVALPESVQALLASRVDRLGPAHRNLLQAAAVFGRRFDPDLVAKVSDTSESAETSFSAMEALDLIHRAEGSNDFFFKHALVRDALYDRLLSGPRAALHLRVADELERRGDNRLIEIAESLAHHYAATTRADKAFTYLAMAGDKSLDVYAVPEAEQYYRQALKLFETETTCEDKSSVVGVVVRLLETLAAKGDYREIGQVALNFMPLIKAAGETPELVIARYFQALSLLANLEIWAAHELMVEACAISERLGDGRARAYGRGGLFYMRSYLGLDPLEVADRKKAEMIEDCVLFGDAYIHNWGYYFVAWAYLYRGLYKEAREAAIELVVSGERRNDPRAIGQANLMLGILRIYEDDPIAARAHLEKCVRLAVTLNERRAGELTMAGSEVLLGRASEGLAQIDAINLETERAGALFMVQREIGGVALALMGRISEGINVLKRQIAQSDLVGDQTRAALCRIILAEIYIQMISGKEEPQAAVLLKNLKTIVGAMIFGARRARALLVKAASHKQLSKRGVTIARVNFDLGVLSAMKKKRDEARRYFEEARVGAKDQGAHKLLQKIDAALAEIG